MHSVLYCIEAPTDNLTELQSECYTTMHAAFHTEFVPRSLYSRIITAPIVLLSLETSSTLLY
jgi:hypothetical protein